MNYDSTHSDKHYYKKWRASEDTWDNFLGQSQFELRRNSQGLVSVREQGAEPSFKNILSYEISSI